MAKPPPSERMGGPELPPHFEGMALWLLSFATGLFIALMFAGSPT